MAPSGHLVLREQLNGSVSITLVDGRLVIEYCYRQRETDLWEDSASHYWTGRCVIMAVSGPGFGVRLPAACGRAV